MPRSGFTYNLSGPNCVLRWARVPRGFSGALDVVVHFHGYKSHNAMRLSDKANASGLDLQAPGVTGPTLALVPHGRAFASRHPEHRWLHVSRHRQPRRAATIHRRGPVRVQGRDRLIERTLDVPGA